MQNKAVSATTQQRLGDSFYEQKLIREQIGQLTGRRFLDGNACQARWAAPDHFYAMWADSTPRHPI